MRENIIGFVIAIMTAPGSFGQDVDRILRFAHTEPAQDIQEIATVIRYVADIRQATADTTERTLTLRGTSGQIALAEWIFEELDKPRDQRSRGSAKHEYRIPGGADEMVRIFYPTHDVTRQRLQEIAVEVRKTTMVRRLFTYNAPQAMALRGTADQMAVAEGLIKERDQ